MAPDSEEDLSSRPSPASVRDDLMCRFAAAASPYTPELLLAWEVFAHGRDRAPPATASLHSSFDQRRPP